MNFNNILLNAAVLLVAVALFTRGFLLMKLEIGRKTPACKERGSLQAVVKDSCWSLPASHFKYGKMVVLIIDALRYDFAFLQEDSTAPFHNKMPVFNDLITKEGCKKARLWRFHADAPTTTMQRLKGLTTGSLPTFIDLSRNFASSEITEDNVIDQIKSSGKNITFMGDDTWMNLFPGRFNRAFPYPSFDVKDLHLVDNGVIKHLLPELKTADWQLLIAHFLGVDHCGHRYGPFHPEMSLKLQQMNGIVEEVARSIDNETLLFVMGDHGMTYTGDHGGETYNEVNSALFAYSPVGAFKECETDDPKNAVVNQVDIVPTLSFLLGTPVPFANLGVVIDDMLPEDRTDFGEVLTDGNKMYHDALVLNTMQIHNYICAYQEASNSLPRDIYSDLKQSFAEVDELFYSEKKVTISDERKFLQYMSSAKHMCQLVWAKFNISLMLSCIGLLVLWLTSTMGFETLHFFPAKTKILSVLVVLNSALIVSSLISTFSVNDVLSLMMCCVNILLLCSITIYCVWKSRFNISIFGFVFPVFLLVLFSISYTTNSYILNEDVFALYIFVSCFLCFPLAIVYREESKSLSVKYSDENVTLSTKLTERKTPTRNEISPANVPYLKLSLCSLLTVICARMAMFFRLCRAEQFWCFKDSDRYDVDTITRYDFARFLTSSVGLAVCLWLVLSRFSTCSFSKGDLKSKLFLLSVTCVIVNWCLHMLPAKLLAFLPSWSGVVFPRLAYFILLVHFILNWFYPFSDLAKFHNVRMNWKSGIETPLSCDEDTLKQKRCSDKHSDHADAYATTQAVIDSLTLSVMSTVVALFILFSMLLGHERAASLSLWFFSAFGVFELVSLEMRQNRSLFVPYGGVILWNILCSFWWFATGHQASISSIRWDAAFVGFQGNHASNLLPAILIILETFSIQILSTAALPLMVFWPYANTAPKHESIARKLVELLLNKPRQLDAILSDLFLKHYHYHLAKMLGCMLCACLHRRHLMVWQIFAPKYLFETLSFVVVVFTSVATFYSVGRIFKKAFSAASLLK